MTTRPDSGRRSDRSHQAILSAALDLTLELGYANVTIEKIAARAGVGKQTIYRWWPSIGTVVLEALNDRIGTAADFRAAADDVVGELARQLAAVAALHDSEYRNAYAGLLAEAQSDRALADSILDTLVNPRVQDCARLIRQGQRSGQIRDDVDPATIVELLHAPLYYRLMLRSEPMSPQQVHQIIDAVFRGLRP